MPLNEIPSYLGPETRRLIDLALDEAWQELKNDLPADPLLARRKMAGTIVALTSVGRRILRNLNFSLFMPSEEFAFPQPQRVTRIRSRSKACTVGLAGWHLSPQRRALTCSRKESQKGP